MIRNILLMAFLMLFMISCSNVKILDPNERDVEVQYVENGYISQNVTSIMQFKLKDTDKNIKNIQAWYNGELMTFFLYFNDSEGEFTVEFDKDNYMIIDYIAYYYYPQNESPIPPYGARSYNPKVENNKLLLNILENDNTKYMEFDFNIESILSTVKDYNYLSEKENYYVKMTILAIEIYNIFKSNGIIRA